MINPNEINADAPRVPEVWGSPTRGVLVRSQHGGFKRVASSATGCAWTSDGADGNPDYLPTDAVELGDLDALRAEIRAVLDEPERPEQSYNQQQYERLRRVRAIVDRTLTR